MIKVDLAIIGGGIAAASAMLTLAATRLSVVRISARAKLQEKIGESLSPSANPILKQLGVWADFLQEGHAPAYATFSAWGGDALVEQNALSQAHGPGWSLDRARFESFLWQQVEHRRRREAPWLETEVKELVWHGQSWDITLRDERKVQAACVLDCSGRAGVVARRVTQRQRKSRLAAAYCFLQQTDEGVEATPGVVVEAVENGWWYSTLLPNGNMVVAFFTDPSLLPEHITQGPAVWFDLMRESCYTGQRVESAGFALAQTRPRLTDAGVLLSERYAEPHWAAAGDAAAAFDPLCAHGMTAALWSGRKAALAIEARFAGDTEPLQVYDDTFRSAVSQYHSAWQRMYAQERRFRHAAFWQQGIGQAAVA